MEKHTYKIDPWKIIEEGWDPGKVIGSESIFSELESDPIISKMAANDVTVLLNKDTLQKEISQLKAEIPGLGEAEVQVNQTQEEIEAQLKIDGVTPEFKKSKDNIPTLTVFDEKTDQEIEKIIGKEAVEKAKAEGKKGREGTDLAAISTRTQIKEIGGKKYRFDIFPLNPSFPNNTIS